MIRSVIREYKTDALRELDRIGDMQELVRPVGVGLRSQYSRDEELRLRIPLCEHPQKRDGAATANMYRFATEHEG